MVEHYLAKVVTRVRFPSPAPDANQAAYAAFFIPQTVNLFLRRHLFRFDFLNY